MNVALNALVFLYRKCFDLPSNDMCFTRMAEEDCESECGKTAFSDASQGCPLSKNLGSNVLILALMAKSLVLYFICPACKNFFWLENLIFLILLKYPQSDIFFGISVNVQFREDRKLLGDVDLKWKQRTGRDARQVFPAVKFHLFFLF